MKSYLNSFSVVSFAVSSGFNKWFTHPSVSCLNSLTGSYGLNFYKKHIFSAI